MSWADGYVSEVNYTYGYYKDLSPLTFNLALLYQQRSPLPDRPLNYLELGFGQGLSLNIHAAALEGNFWGTDFNPAHAAQARELAQIAGSGAHIFDHSFAELAANPDLPEFDVIALHGVWSWISDANRKVIVDIARRKLAPGGVLFMSYNVLPGWAPTLPLRQLLRLHTELADRSGTGMISRIDNAMDFAQALSEAGAGYFRAQPMAAEWLKTMREQERGYLAHEYFNSDWHPMTFADAAKQLEDGKLTFAASAHFLDHWDLLNLSEPQQGLLAKIDHWVLRETVRDYCMNRQFRRDIWVKGPRTISAFQQIEALKGLRFVLTNATENISLTVQGAQVEAGLTQELYLPIIDALARNAYAAKTLGELMEMLPQISFTLLSQAMVIFAGMGHVSPAQSDRQAHSAKAKTDSLNIHLLNRSVFGETVPFLASPVTGGGVLVPRFEQWFIRAIKQGKVRPEEWAMEAWQILTARSEGLVKNNQVIASAEEAIAGLTDQARDFARSRLSMLNALMVI